MTFLCIIFVSPLYFLLRNKWGAFFINLFFYGIACLLILTFFGIALAPLPWLIGVLHACFYYRKEQMHNVIETLTTKMAEKLKQREAPPLLTPGSRSIPPGTPKG